MKRKSIFKSTSYKRSKMDFPLAQGLAYTPSQMYDMAKKGLPISSDNSQIDTYYDGEVNLDFEPLLERQRGVDPARLWNVEQDIKKRGKKAYKTALDAYNLQQQYQSKTE